jgi:signal transduction histidine kinase
MQKITDNINVLIVIAMVGTVVMVFFFIFLQMRNQNKILRQKRKIQEAEIAHQKDLLQSVITSQEAERKRIGMDLHDEVGAALSTLRIKIERNAGKDATAGDEATIYKSDIDKIIDNMRNISHSLSPRISGNFGFYDAIHELSDGINRSGKINMAVHFDENKLPMFANEQAPMALYRVIAELINNTLKHASAQHIQLTVDVSDSKMKIVYNDDGIGIPQNREKKSSGMGMQNIESRLGIIGAEWEIQKPENGGYRMLIAVPLN